MKKVIVVFLLCVSMSLTLTLFASIGFGNTPTQTAVAYSNRCFVEMGNDGDNNTDYLSPDATALQEAVKAATAGETLYLAGTCIGVDVQNSLTQTIYISQNLTLQGGYTYTNWLLPPDSDTYPTTLDAAGNGRVATITDTANVTLQNLTFTSGQAGDGGGLYIAASSSLTLSQSIVVSNSAVNGGAVFNDGYLLIVSSRLLTNTVTSVSFPSLGMEGHGGGLQNDGVATVMNSTFSGNRASDFGGGLYSNTGATTYVGNSTFSGNTGSIGGAINNDGIVHLSHSTLTDNATGFGSGIFADQATTHITNTIVANNDGSFQCFTFVNPLIDHGYNLDSGASCGFSALNNSLNNTDPLLGPLSDNGGETKTHALQAGSPAIDYIPTAACPLNVDQRNLSRPQGFHCDIGAVEVAGTGPAITPTLTLTVTASSTIRWSDHLANCVFTLYSSTTPYGNYTILAQGLLGLTYQHTPSTIPTYYYVVAYACGSDDTAVTPAITTFSYPLTPGD